MEKIFFRQDEPAYPPMDLKFEGEGRLLDNPTPQEARDFFVRSQQGEMQRAIRRVDDYFTELEVQIAHLYAIQKNGVKIGTTIEQINALRHQIETLVEEVKQTYEQRIVQISALSDEEIVSQDPEDARRTVVSGVVRKLMDESYPNTRAQWGRVNELKRNIAIIVDDIIAKYDVSSGNASSTEV